MKLPSFIKLPGHKKFTITPRYYDPIKEEIMERTEAIKRKMSREEKVESEIDDILSVIKSDQTSGDKIKTPSNTSSTEEFVLDQIKN